MQVTLQKYHAEVYDHIKSNKLMFNTSEHAVQAVKEGWVPLHSGDQKTVELLSSSFTLLIARDFAIHDLFL